MESMGSPGGGDLVQIGHQGAEVDPAFEAGLAMIPAATQEPSPLAHTDPALDPGPEAVGAPEPAGSLDRSPLWWRLALHRNGHPLDSQGLGHGFIAGSIEATIGGQQVGGMAEAPTMGPEPSFQQGGIGG